MDRRTLSDTSQSPSPFQDPSLFPTSRDGTGAQQRRQGVTGGKAVGNQAGGKGARVKGAGSKGARAGRVEASPGVPQSPWPCRSWAPPPGARGRYVPLASLAARLGVLPPAGHEPAPPPRARG